jgi:hypothetical protein
MSNSKVLFDPFPKQIEFLDAIFSEKYDVILYGGSIRGGKTFAGLGALVMLAKAYPNSRWAVVRKSLAVIKNNTLPAWNKIKPESFIQSYNIAQQLVTFTNGSQLIFFSENYEEDKELDRWKGLEVNGFLLEECNEIQEVSFNKAIERRGSYVIPHGGKQPKPLIIMTCNPTQGWVKKKFYTPWKEGELRKNWLYIPAKITDNPIVMKDTAYVEGLKDMPTYQYEVFVNGNWDIQNRTGGEFYKGFDMDRHVSECEYDPTKPLHVSFDDNVNPYLPVGIFQIETTEKEVDGRVVLKHEARMVHEIAAKNPFNTVNWVCSEVSRVFSNHKAGMFVYGDATSKKADTKLEQGYNFFRLIMDELADFKPTLRLMRSNPSVAMRGSWINSVFAGRGGHVKMVIGRECHHTIEDLMMLKESPDGTKHKETFTDPETKVRAQKYGHFSDLMDYFVCTAFNSEYARYQSGRGAGLISHFKRKSNHRW